MFTVLRGTIWCSERYHLEWR